MAAAALAVKLTTPGPVLFRQRRVGQDGEVIEVLKFRTMYADRCDPNAAQQTRRNDPRITPVGRFLRRFSLDELPQLLNVIGGSMSLVGPRPHALGVKAGAIVLDTLPHYHARHNVKPGITGWAQINGCRGALDSAEKAQQRIVHDLYYILNWSLLFDLRIIKRTAWVILFDRSAF